MSVRLLRSSPTATFKSRHIHLKGALGKTRIETWMGREHMVVPVTMLMEGVVWPSTSEEPEFVPFNTLAKAPSTWDGEPVLTNHPSLSEDPNAFGNLPEVLEAMQFGRVFGSHMQARALVAEAWLDIIRAEEVKGGKKYLERLEADDIIEVSVGTFVVTEEKKGTWRGIKYGSIWREAYPDHLAFLPEGVLGACSVDMGCGASRSALRHLVTVNGFRKEKAPMRLADSLRSLKEETLTLLRFRPRAELEELESGTSDTELRMRLSDALREVEPGYLGIDAVFPDDNQVVYACMPGDAYFLFRRSYTADDSKITLNDDRIEVQPKIDYVPAQAAAPVAEHVHNESCGCGGKTTGTQGQAAARATTEVPSTQSASSAQGEAMHKHAERHTALIANPRTPWRETDRKHLETIDDDRLKELEQDAKAREEEAAKVKAADEKAAADKKAADDAAAATTTTPAAPAQAAAPKAAAAAAATPASVGDADVDAYLADPNTPQFAKDLCLAQLQGQTERRNELLTTLKGNDNIARAWKPEELDAIANTMLEKLAASLPTQATQVGRVVDFSARGARPTGLGGTDATKVPAPPSLTAHVQQLAAKKAAGQ